MLHNALQMVNYVGLMNRLAQESTFEDYKEICLSHIKGTRSITLEAKATFDFVDHYMNHGIDSAHTRFKHWSTQDNLLFGSMNQAIIDNDDGTSHASEVVGDFDYQEEILRKYEKGYTAPKKKVKAGKSFIKKKIQNKSLNRNKKSLSWKQNSKKPKKVASNGKDTTPAKRSISG